LDAKQKSNELEYDFNPLRYYRDYYQVPPEDRIHLLKALVHWVLQDGPVVRSGIEEDNDFYVIEPFGADQAKRVYWYFGGRRCILLSFPLVFHALSFHVQAAHAREYWI
jgi:hypothetical protein